MASKRLLKRVSLCLFFSIFLAKLSCCYAVAQIFSPFGTYTTSWVGNTFGGNGNAEGNGYGYWVQDGVSAVAVSPDGTVFNEVSWDEAGHGVSMYKNGQVNRVPITALSSSVTTPNGFDTSGTAICVDGSNFYIANNGMGLLRFSWTPGNINSAKFLSDVLLPEQPKGLSCRNGQILVGYSDKIEWRTEGGMQVTSTFPETNLTGVTIAPDGSIWDIAAGAIHHLTPFGVDYGITIPSVGVPTSLAWGRNGALMVTDDGPAQQVLFYNLAFHQPLQMRAIGTFGGVGTSYTGVYDPQKLFGLRGCGMDALGNVYVAMSFGLGPTGSAFIREFNSDGSFGWEVHSASFVNSFGFEPGSNGSIVYGPTTIWNLNLNQINPAPGSEQALAGITLDQVKDPSDIRQKSSLSVYPRLIDGTQLLYANGQYGGGYTIFSGTPASPILHQVANAPGTGWAWQVTDNGDIWNGDGAGNQIKEYSLQSITNGVPIYDWKNPKTWPRPSDFSQITRIIYNQASDSLYVFGYLAGQSTYGLWGGLGYTARRYDGWLSGNPHIVWTNSGLPTQMEWVNKVDIPVSAKDASLAGQYLFLGMNGKLGIGNVPQVDILDAADGALDGSMIAGPAVGGIGSAEDLVGSIKAIERSNGEYLVLIEEDLRSKNILFRWTP